MIISPYFLNQMNGNSAGYWSTILNKRFKANSNAASYTDASTSANITFANNSRDILSTVVTYNTPWGTNNAALTTATAASGNSVGVNDNSMFCAENLSNANYSFDLVPFMIFMNDYDSMSSIRSGSDRYGMHLWNIVNQIQKAVYDRHNQYSIAAMDHFLFCGQIEAVLLSGNAGDTYPYPTGAFSADNFFADYPTSEVSNYIITNGLKNGNSTVTKYKYANINFSDKPITTYFRPEQVNGLYPYGFTSSQSSINTWQQYSPSNDQPSETYPLTNLMLNTSDLESENWAQDCFMGTEDNPIYYRKILATDDITGLTYLKTLLNMSTGGWPDIDDDKLLCGVKGSNSAGNKPGVAMFSPPYASYTIGINGANIYTSTFYLLVRTILQIYDGGDQGISGGLISTIGTQTCYWKVVEKWGPFIIAYVPDSVNGLTHNVNQYVTNFDITNHITYYPSFPVIIDSNYNDFANTLYIQYNKTSISGKPIIVYGNKSLNTSDAAVATAMSVENTTSGESSTNGGWLKFPVNVTVFSTKNSSNSSTDVSTQFALYERLSNSVQGHPLEETINVYNAYDIYASNSNTSHGSFMSGKIGDVSSGVTLTLSTQNRSVTFYVKEVAKEFVFSNGALTLNSVYDYPLGSASNQNHEYPYLGVMGKSVSALDFYEFDNSNTATQDDLDAVPKISLSTDSLGEKSVNVTVVRQKVNNNQKNDIDSNSIFAASSTFTAAASSTQHDIYAVTVTIPNSITQNLNASNNYFYLVSSAAYSGDGLNNHLDSPSTAPEVYLKVGINYTANYLDGIDVSVNGQTYSYGSTIPTIETWSVPTRFTPSAANVSIWNTGTPHAMVPIEFIFKDDSDNPFVTSFIISNLGTHGQHFLLWNSTGYGTGEGGSAITDTTYTPSTPNFTGYLYPTHNGGAYSSMFPYPSNGNPTAFTVSGPSGTNVSINVPVLIHKTTSEFDAADASGNDTLHTAGDTITLNLSKDGEETWADVCYSASLKDSTGGTIPSGSMPTITSSGFDNNGHYSIVFANTLASTWTGRIVITFKDHYNQYTDEYVAITVQPAVQGITVSYSGNIVASDSLPGDIGEWWYRDPSVAPHTVSLELTGDVSVGNITWAYTPTNGLITAGSGTVSSGQNVFTINSANRNAANTEYSITAASYLRPELVASLNVTPKKITSETTITSSQDDVSVNPGGTFTFVISMNGDESFTDYTQGNTLPFIFKDVNGNDLDETNYIGSGKILSYAAPTLNSSTNLVQSYQCVFSVSDSVATDTVIRIYSSVANQVSNTITSSSYITLKLNKTTTTSLKLYDLSDNEISFTANQEYWCIPSDTFKLYGVVSPTTIDDSLRHISYLLTGSSGGSLVYFAAGETPIDYSNIPSDKTDGKITLVFSGDSNVQRNEYYTLTATSKQTPTVTKSFSITPLRITTYLDASLTANPIRVGDSTILTCTINGDENISGLSLEYKVGSGSYSSSVPTTYISINSGTASNNSRTKTYTITAAAGVTSTTTLTIRCNFTPHGASSPIQEEVTLTLKPSSDAYSINATISSERVSADKNKLYSDGTTSDIIRIDVTLGSSISMSSDGYKIKVGTGSANKLQYYNGSSWSNIGTSYSSAITSSPLYVRKNVASTDTGTVTITLQAGAKDASDPNSTYDNTPLALQLGNVTYSQHTAPGNSQVWRGSAGDTSLYKEDTVQFIATFTPALGNSSSIGSSHVVWTSSGFMTGASASNDTSTAKYTGMSSADAGNTTTATFTYDYSDSLSNIPAAVRGSASKALTHVFTVTSLGNTADGNSLLLTPTERIIETNGSSANTTYTVVRGAYVNPVTATNVSYSKVSGDPGSKTLSTSVSGDTITSTVSGDPDTPCTHTISLTTTNVLGDTITASNVATLYWRSKTQASLTVSPATSNDGSINYPRGDYQTSTNYNITKGSNIGNVSFVRIWTGTEANPTNVLTTAVSGSISGNTLTLTALATPASCSLSDGVYNIYLEASTNFGDTVTFKTAGTVYWAAGNAGFVLDATPIDASVSGFGKSITGEEITYTVTCYHMNGGNTVNDSWSVTSSETWCKCSSTGGSNGSTIKVYADSKSLGGRTATLTFSTNHGGTSDTETITRTFVQRQINVTAEIAVNPSSLTYDASASNNTNAIQVTRCVYVKSDSLANSGISSQDVAATWSKEVTSGNGWISISNIQGSQYVDVNISENIDTSNRSGNIRFTTVKPSSLDTVTVTAAIANVPVTQTATTYSACVFSIAGVNNNYVPDDFKASGITTEYDVSCYYTKTQTPHPAEIKSVVWSITDITYSAGTGWIQANNIDGNKIRITVGVNDTSDVRNGVITLTSTAYTVGNTTYVASVTRTITINQGNASVEFNTSSIEKNYDTVGEGAVPFSELAISTSGTNSIWTMTFGSDTNSLISAVKVQKQGESIIDNPLGVSIQGDASVRVDFASKNLLAGGNTASVPLYSIRRTDTVSRSATLVVRANDNQDATDSVNITQTGYSWTPYLTYDITKNGIFDASDNSATLTITSNFDYTLSTPEWITYQLVSGRAFTDNDDETVVITKVYNLSFNCNFGNNSKSADILIQNYKHHNSEGVKNGQSETIPVTQNTGTKSIRLLYQGSEVPTTGATSLEYSSLAASREFVVEAKFTNWEASTNFSWIHVNPDTNTRTETSYINNTVISISVDAWDNVTEGRTGSITFTSIENPNKSITYTVSQTPASIYFVVLDSVEDMNKYLRREITPELIAGDEIIPLPNTPISAEGARYEYYVLYYYGSATQHGWQCNTSYPIYTRTSLTEVSGLTEQIPPLSDIKKVTLIIDQNITTQQRPVYFTLDSGATNTVRVRFDGDNQDRAEYSAEEGFELSGIIGEVTLSGGYEIPVYGGTYNITVKNKLAEDTIIVDRVRLDTGLVENQDHALEDYDTWYSVPSSLPTISKGIGKTATIPVTIKPYTIKDSNESTAQYSNGGYINRKYYSIIVDAHTGTDPASKPQTLLNPRGSALIAVQNSIDLELENANKSWQLLDDGVERADGSKKIYCRNSYFLDNNKDVYSQDTGNIVFPNVSPESLVPKEEQCIINIVNTTNIALDVRVGVK